MMTTGAPQMTHFVHGLTDFIPKNVIAGDPYHWKYLAQDERELHDHVTKQATGKGFRHDSPEIGKVISDSFRKFPELQRMYHRGI